MREYFRSTEERMGKIHEHFLFGDVTTGKNRMRYEEALKQAMIENKMAKNPSDIPFNALLNLVRNVQVGDPYNPSKLVMRDLRESVVKKLGLNQKTARSLGLYSAIGTPLDSKGVDVFIQWKTENGQIKIATIDATINPRKIEEKNIKADVLVGEIPDPEENLKLYQAFIDRIADQIVMQLTRS